MLVVLFLLFTIVFGDKQMENDEKRKVNVSGDKIPERFLRMEFQKDFEKISTKKRELKSRRFFPNNCSFFQFC